MTSTTSTSYWVTSNPGQSAGRILGDSCQLPDLLGKAKSTAPSKQFSTGTGDRFWSMTSTDAFSQTRRSPRATKPMAISDTGLPSSSSAQEAASLLAQRVEKELDFQGLMHSPPSLERVRVFSAAFSEIIDRLPSYRGLLLAVQKEYDGLVAKLHTELNAAAPMEARLKTMKAASLSYVGESMAWFQIEITELRKRLHETEGELTKLREQREQNEQHKLQLQRQTEEALFQSKESHSANIDITKHMDRMEKQVELLRKQDKETQGQMNQMQTELKEKKSRIVTVEGQLEAERNKVAAMVPREDMDAVKEECQAIELKFEELEENFQSKQRDYMSIVEAYTKLTGQGIDEFAGNEARPLTPRPRWFHCRGLLDPDYEHTVEKAETSQEMLQHMLVCSRTLLAAYGLSAAGNKCQVFKLHVSHPLAAPLTPAPLGGVHAKNSEGLAASEEDVDTSQIERKGSEKMKSFASMKDGEDWLPCDIDPETPQAFKHSEKVKNLRFSRRKVGDFLENLIQQRLKHGSHDLATPFLQCLLDHLPEDLEPDEQKLFAINVYAALRRYSAEPDFFAYLLLLTGKISDNVVRDNKRLCAELLKIFSNHFESSDGSRNITKQKFFYGLREVLPNKGKEMWQDLVTYFPAGGAELLVNYEALLFDDPYILSPIVYALRLQHLEEAVDLSGRLDTVARGCVEGKDGSLTYAAVETAFKDDAEFQLIHAEDLARAFDTHVMDVTPDTKTDVEPFLSKLKQGDIFHILYFPALASEEVDPGAQEDMP